MIKHIPLESGCFYHIYNRGNNSEIIFIEDSNYLHFLKLLEKHIVPVADVYAFCLMNNHFHFLIKVKTEEEGEKIILKVEKCFSNLFNAYAKAFNKRYHRTGKLFEERFKRKKVEDDFYLTELIYYIHANPQKHNIMNDFREYKYYSYQIILSNKPTLLKREEVVDWFGGKSFFIECHQDKHRLLNEANFKL